MSIVNTRIKLFDGHGETYSFYENGVHIGPRPPNPLLAQLPKKPPGHSIKRGETVNQKRAMQAVYDLARGNEWDWFVTLTLDPEKTNRFDYEECINALSYYTRKLMRNGNEWVIVPEQHKKGSWHFHGLIKGDLKVTPALNYWTKQEIFDSKGNQIYNILNFKQGFSTATKIKDSAKASSYISKYMVKKMQIPKGKKRYWSSKGLNRPEIVYLDTTDYDQDMLEADASFVKKCSMRFGTLTIADYRKTSEYDIDAAETVSLEEIEEKIDDALFAEIFPEYSWERSEWEQLRIEQNIN